MSLKTQGLLLPRQYAYNALHIIFGQAPTESILEALLSDTSLETLRAPAENSEVSYAKAVEGFGKTRNTYLDPANKQEALKSLDLEYTRLFVGPNALPAPPWEMVYRTGKRELFQPGVLEIRAIYKSVGCLPAEAPHVSDDHLGIELDFMRFLCEKTLDALEHEDTKEVEKLESLQLSFLKEHLLVWVPKFLTDFVAATQEPLYISSGKLLQEYIELDAQLLQE